jgi:putative ABC transport system permease protein
MINNTDFLSSQYDVLKGTWPKAKDEIVLVTDEYNEIPDYFLYALGLKNEKELVQAMLKDDSMQSTTYTFDELLSRTFKLVLDSSYYTKNSNGYYSKKTLNSDGFESILDQSLTLKIVGIVRPKDVDNSSISSTIGYTSMLKEYILQQNRASEVALAQEEKIVRDENGQFVSGTSVISGAQLTKSGYESIFNAFGIRDESTPYSITIYPNSFDAKDKVIEFIDEYNEEAAKKARNDLILQYAEKNQTASKEELASVEKAAKINYSDSVKTVINRMNKIFKSIRYVLVIFVVISLIVSGIMIGIITYISVLERTKEIGILRSLGASRMDVSTIFNAETLLLGLFSGIIGVVLGFLFTVPMNLLIEYFAGIKLQASLPLWGALALVVISMILTLLGGIIPSVYASTKDPVVALRSE